MMSQPKASVQKRTVSDCQKWGKPKAPSTVRIREGLRTQRHLWPKLTAFIGLILMPMSCNDKIFFWDQSQIELGSNPLCQTERGGREWGGRHHPHLNQDPRLWISFTVLLWTGLTSVGLLSRGPSSSSLENAFIHFHENVSQLEFLSKLLGHYWEDI